MSREDDQFDFSSFESDMDPMKEEEQESFAPQPHPTRPPARGAAPYPPPNQPSRPPNQAVDKKIVSLTSDIPIQIVAVLGKKPVTIKDIVSLRMGQVVELNRLPNEAIDLVANGKLIAKGELVEVEGRLGVRILKIFD